MLTLAVSHHNVSVDSDGWRRVRRNTARVTDVPACDIMEVAGFVTTGAMLRTPPEANVVYGVLGVAASAGATGVAGSAETSFTLGGTTRVFMPTGRSLPITSLTVVSATEARLVYAAPAEVGFPTTVAAAQALAAVYDGAETDTVWAVWVGAGDLGDFGVAPTGVVVDAIVANPLVSFVRVDATTLAIIADATINPPLNTQLGLAVNAVVTGSVAAPLGYVRVNPATSAPALAAYMQHTMQSPAGGSLAVRTEAAGVVIAHGENASVGGALSGLVLNGMYEARVPFELYAAQFAALPVDVLHAQDSATTVQAALVAAAQGRAVPIGVRFQITASTGAATLPPSQTMFFGTAPPAAWGTYLQTLLAGLAPAGHITVAQIPLATGTVWGFQSVAPFTVTLSTNGATAGDFVAFVTRLADAGWVLDAGSTTLVASAHLTYAATNALAAPRVYVLPFDFHPATQRQAFGHWLAATPDARTLSSDFRFFPRPPTSLMQMRRVTNRVAVVFPVILNTDGWLPGVDGDVVHIAYGTSLPQTVGFGLVLGYSAADGGVLVHMPQPPAANTTVAVNLTVASNVSPAALVLCPRTLAAAAGRTRTARPEQLGQPFGVIATSVRSLAGPALALAVRACNPLLYLDVSTTGTAETGEARMWLTNEGIGGVSTTTASVVHSQIMTTRVALGGVALRPDLFAVRLRYPDTYEPVRDEALELQIAISLYPRASSLEGPPPLPKSQPVFRELASRRV